MACAFRQEDFFYMFSKYKPCDPPGWANFGPQGLILTILVEVLDDATMNIRERSGSVVEYLTWDQRAVGSSLTGVTALCPWARTLILA